jgi:hypothetical protein
MKTFSKYLENKNKAFFISRTKRGEITFSENGTEQKYYVDALLIYDPHFEKLLRKNPEEALNMVKKHGEKA